MTLVYKIVSQAQWSAAQEAGVFAGAEVDHQDGYIHLSNREQVEKTVALYFADRDDLVLVALEAEPLGAALKWEPSRGGDLFPHLYATLPIKHVAWTKRFSSRNSDELRASFGRTLTRNADRRLSAGPPSARGRPSRRHPRRPRASVRAAASE